MRWVSGVLGALVALLCVAPAQAAWFKAETDRLIVYGDVREDALRDYAVKLSTFDQILRLYNPAAGNVPPARKLEVYLVRGHADLERVQPHLSPIVVGFYSASPHAVFAMAMTYGTGQTKDEVLFHEYGHHFMLENFPAPYPTWFIEGWADYFSTTKITATGFQVGGYNEDRVYWLSEGDWLPTAALLTKSPGESRDPAHYYAQAWLLTHYMFDTPERAAQLNKATLAIANGADPLKAMESATGLTIQQLTVELKKYRQIHVGNFAGHAGPTPQVTVTPMPEARTEFMLDRLRVFTGSAKQPDTRFLADLRARAAKAAGDSYAQATLALAEYAYGDPATGEGIVRKLLDARPDDIDALTMGGLGNMVAGEWRADRRAEFYRAARPYLVKAYGLDKDDFRTLLAYAESRTIEPAYPNDNDINALMSARALAPSVQEASLWTGAALMKRGRDAEAKPLLAAVANNPHNVRLAKAARAVLDGKSLDEAMAAAGPDEADPTRPDPTKPGPTKPGAAKPGAPAPKAATGG